MNGVIVARVTGVGAIVDDVQRTQEAMRQIEAQGVPLTNKDGYTTRGWRITPASGTLTRTWDPQTGDALYTWRP